MRSLLRTRAALLVSVIAAVLPPPTVVVVDAFSLVAQQQRSSLSSRGRTTPSLLLLQSSPSSSTTTTTETTTTTTTTETSTATYTRPLDSSKNNRGNNGKKIQHRDEYDRESWTRGYTNVETETCFELVAESGTDSDGSSDGSNSFPTDLVGTFYQNGHTKFRISDTESVVHPFDGDGMIQAVTFAGDGTAWFRNRYVRTAGYVAEEDAGKICYRGVFGTAKNAGAWWSNCFDVTFKNVANTHVLSMAGRLYALWEAGLPYEVDPVTLETIGESTLEGSIQDDSGNGRYAAHYKIDPVTGNVCNFAILPGTQNPVNTHCIRITEHDCSTGQLIYEATHEQPVFGVTHDTAITEDFFVFLSPNFSFKPLGLLLGIKGTSQCIEFDAAAETATLVLVPRRKTGQHAGKKQDPIRIDVPNMMSFHTCNAYQDEDDGTVVVDMVVAVKEKNTAGFAGDTGGTSYPDKPIWETMDFQTDVPPNELRRFRIDPATAKLLSAETISEQCGATIEFPVVNPTRVGQSYRYAYVLCSASESIMGPHQGLAKLDVTTGTLLEKWLPEPHEYLTEPAFCPRSTREGQEEEQEEDDGYLVSYVVDGRNLVNYLVVFDAANISKGPVVKSKLQGWCVNHSLHGTFVPDDAPPELTDAIKATFSLK